MQPDKNQNLSSNFHRLAWSNLFAQSAEQIALAAAPLVAVLAPWGNCVASWVASVHTDLAIPACRHTSGPTG